MPGVSYFRSKIVAFLADNLYAKVRAALSALLEE
jgi:hypothetical protein